MTTLAEHILAVCAKATAQAPLARAGLVLGILRRRPETTPDETADALEALVDSRQISTCRITRAGITQDVYWPTGLRPQLTAPKPKEPTVPKPAPEKQETQASRLIKAIIMHGPLTARDLAEKTGIKISNIDGSLQSALKAGTITTRTRYVAEDGRERRHFMSANQAAVWDGDTADMPDPPEHQGHAMDHPDAHPEASGEPAGSAEATLARLRQLEEDNFVLATERDSLLGRLGANDIIEAGDFIDALREELSRLRAGAGEQAGRPALLLVDSAELTEVEPLPAEMNLREMRQEAMNAVHQGHAARAFVVRILGEAVRTASWTGAA